ncbi:hypothetical protein LIER_34559 [Lithospermum erythrorhizon]|uniref:Uncharacterized protein n=1 Tax=Lithospermum erythrorhizon TaxID=34254 RepID=A0AAV3S4B6_LITER
MSWAKFAIRPVTASNRRLQENILEEEARAGLIQYIRKPRRLLKRDNLSTSCSEDDATQPPSQTQDPIVSLPDDDATQPPSQTQDPISQDSSSDSGSSSNSSSSSGSDSSSDNGDVNVVASADSDYFLSLEGMFRSVDDVIQEVQVEQEDELRCQG